jgi:hypothetical protein
MVTPRRWILRSRFHGEIRYTICKLDDTHRSQQIDEDRLSMSKRKIQKVLDFPKPQTAHQMKQFVGLANYYHNHVPHHSDIMKALHDMITGYEKRTRAKVLVWTEAGIIAFYQIILCSFQEWTALSSFRLTALTME